MNKKEKIIESLTKFRIEEEYDCVFCHKTNLVQLEASPPISIKNLDELQKIEILVEMFEEYTLEDLQRMNLFYKEISNHKVTKKESNAFEEEDLKHRAERV